MMDQDSKYVGRHILLPAVLDLDSVSDPPFRSIDGHGPSASPLFSGLATPSYGGFASPPYGGLASPHQGGFATPQYRSDYVTASDAGNSQPQDSDTTEASSDEHCPSGRIISHFSNIPKHRQKDMHGTCVDHGQDEDIEKWEITFGRGLADHDQIDWDRLFNMAGGQRVPKRNLQYGETTFDKLDFSTSGLRVYSRRWYILVVYSLYAFTQACVWNTFGPISSSSKRVFGWGNGMIALLSNLGPISYVLSGVFFSWMLDTNGLRYSCLISCAFVATGTALRCITLETPFATGLIILGQFLNGLGGPVALAGAPVVSSMWFPSRERITATAIGSASLYAGVASAFILGPNIVPDFSSVSRNTTTHPNASKVEADQMAQTRDGMRLFLIIEASWACSLFIVMLAYFPKRPPVSPSASSVLARDDFITGFGLDDYRRKDMWQVAIIYGVPLGVLNCWSSLLSLNLAVHGIAAQEAGWIGFYGTVTACVASLIAARFVDQCMRVVKWFIFGLYCLGTAIFVVFCLAYIEVFPPSKAIFYVTIMAGITVLDSTAPMLFELACEVAYPIGEGMAAVMMTLICNAAGFVFLFIMMIPNIGTAWMNWAVVSTIAVCLPMLVVMKENLNRLAVDEQASTLSSINLQYMTQINAEIAEQEAMDKTGSDVDVAQVHEQSPDFASEPTTTKKSCMKKGMDPSIKVERWQEDKDPSGAGQGASGARRGTKDLVVPQISMDAAMEESRGSFSMDCEFALKRVVQATNLLALYEENKSREGSFSSADGEAAIQGISEAIYLLPDEDFGQARQRASSRDITLALKEVVETTQNIQERDAGSGHQSIPADLILELQTAELRLKRASSMALAKK